MPTFFVTITCNPAWPEIQPPGDAIMTCRVFKLTVDAFMKDLRAGTIFPGALIYFLKVIENQKRG